MLRPGRLAGAGHAAQGGSPAEPATLRTAVPNWRVGDTIPVGHGRTLRVTDTRAPDDPDGDPVLVVADRTSSIGDRMHEPPLPPASQDWQSPEFGEAIRIILDVFESITNPPEETAARFRRLEDLAREQPQITVQALFALFHAALGLPALLPAPRDQIADVRSQIEQKVYADIDAMPDAPA